MRHLRVPNRAVEKNLALLRDRGWLARGMRVFSLEDDEYRLIPLDPGAPIDIPPPFDDYDVALHDGLLDTRVDSDWWNHLSLLVSDEEIEAHGDSWPSSHEFISDMMVVRIEEELEKYSPQIAKAKLLSHPHIRLVLNDEGVQGELRIRKLTPIGARFDGEIVTRDIPESVCNTRVLVRESGRAITCDPNMAYFSTKLQSERLETLSLAKELQELLARPLRVCDPFCGVGPALATLLSQSDLVGAILASDLNPNAVEMLLENLSRWDGRNYPEKPSNISRIFPDRFAGIADATRLCEDPELTGSWDLLIVNLPHKTIDLLPFMVPLLDRSEPSMVRGRVIASDSDMEEANIALRNNLPPTLIGKPAPKLKVKRDYSSTLRLCSFEAWIAPE
ncbi:MAG: hypothetical protein CMB67_00245 [Euryarchaeota archaeon]|nr:hypothetical protein [Euryarchaeota archaeon]